MIGPTKGEMAERLKAAVLKTVVGANPPGVRIPLSPPLPRKYYKSANLVGALEFFYSASDL